MILLLSSLLRAIGQLRDPAILRVLGKSVAATLAIFAALGATLWWLIEPIVDGWIAAYIDDTYTDGVAALLSALVLAVMGWLLFRLIALAVVQFFADEIVAAVEARHYPDRAATARTLPLHEEIAYCARAIIRALIANIVAAPVAIALIFTAIGPAVLLFAVNAWLLGRELRDMA